MSRWTHVITNEHGHTTRYEALRHDAMERHGALLRHGLAVLVRHGVAAWMEACSKLPTPPRRSAEDDTPKPCTLPAGLSPEVVNVLVAMTMGHMEQVHP